MLKIENTEVFGWKAAIRGMRNPMNSWDRSDSGFCKGGDNGIGCSNCVHQGCEHSYDHSFQIGKEDYKLMKMLCNAGADHRKFMRMITVYVDLTGPLYWWKEFDTYKVGTVANSCSTMHKIAAKEFVLDDFSHEHLLDIGEIETDNKIPSKHIISSNGVGPTQGFNTSSMGVLKIVIDTLNAYRDAYLWCNTDNKKEYWWQMIQLLPSSYNQRRTVMLSYETLANMYKSRRHHPQDEWHTFCDMVESLPYSELITGNAQPKEE